MNKILLISITTALAFVSCRKAKDANPNQPPPITALPIHEEAHPTTHREIKKLNTSAFPSLPTEIQIFLNSGGYGIPQVAEENTPHNVISGAFFTANQVDWVVLASKNGMSEIYIFHNGSTRTISNIGKRADDEIRVIQVATPSEINRHYAAYGGSKPPEPMDHDGIDDGLYGKASMVYYFYNNQWQELQGAD